MRPRKSCSLDLAWQPGDSHTLCIEPQEKETVQTTVRKEHGFGSLFSDCGEGNGLWFFPPSFPIQISHINYFVHSEKLKVAPLPSAKSELVLLRCVVMICHQRDRSDQKDQ